MYTIEKNQLSAALQCAAKKDIRYYLNGIFLDPRGFAVATNGHMMLAIKLAASEPDSPARVPIIIERDFAERVVKATDKKFPQITFTLEAGRVKASGSFGNMDSAPIDGTFPDWQRLIPRECGDVRGHYQSDYLAAFQKVRDLLMNGRRGGFPELYALDDESPALVRNIGYGALGIVMPFRADKVDADLLRSVVKDFLAVQS